MPGLTPIEFAIAAVVYLFVIGLAALGGLSAGVVWLRTRTYAERKYITLLAAGNGAFAVALVVAFMLGLVNLLLRYAPLSVAGGLAVLAGIVAWCGSWVLLAAFSVLLINGVPHTPPVLPTPPILPPDAPPISSPIGAEQSESLEGRH